MSLELLNKKFRDMMELSNWKKVHHKGGGNVPQRKVNQKRLHEAISEEIRQRHLEESKDDIEK